MAAAMAYGYAFGQRRLWINRFDLPVTGLDQRLDGRTIVQISDIHLGTYMPAERVERYVERVNALEPDLIVITGDITDGLAHAPETFRALGGLRGRYGVLAVLGNHDVYTGADEVEAALRTYTEFTVLRDQTTTVEIDGGRLAVVGLDDRGLDWARGLPECAVLERLWAELPDELPSLVLTHRPDLFGHAARLGATLVLAGHTHGGQLAIPWRRGRAATFARFMTRFPRGTYRHGDSVLHVNLGLGVTGQPVRVGTPREITAITLRTQRLAN